MSILKVSIRQIKAAREMLGWSQADLAKKAAVSLPTVKRLEAAAAKADRELGGRGATGDLLTGALEAAGVTFVMQDDHGGPGVRIRRR